MKTLSLLCLSLLIPLLSPAEPVIISLSNYSGPNTETVTDRGTKELPNRLLRRVTLPTLTIFTPENISGKIPLVVICPGGSYQGLAIDKEGYEIAKWLNSIGVAGAVLKYRLPTNGISGTEKPLPLQDVEKAMELVRSRAREFHIDPKRVGVMGFSAGGHLASTLATHWSRKNTRPDFAILCYPVISMEDPVGHTGSRQALLGGSPDKKLIAFYSNDLHVTKKTPPTFLIHAKDDPVKVENSLRFKAALDKKGVRSELVLFEKGGHGYGLGIGKGEVAAWPERCAAWMKSLGILK